MWDLLDLATLFDLGRERGIRAASNWRRYDDLPAPLVAISTGEIYSRRQVYAWQERRWPAGRQGGRGASARVRRVTKPPNIEPRLWDLTDLAGSADLAVHLGVSRSLVTMTMLRPGSPAPLLHLSTRPVFSRAAVDRYWRRIHAQ